MDTVLRALLLWVVPGLEVATGAWWLVARPRWATPRRVVLADAPAYKPPPSDDGGPPTLSYERRATRVAEVDELDVPRPVARAMFAAAAIYALAAVAFVVAAWLHARWQLGRWPRPYRDEVTTPAGLAAGVALCGCLPLHPLVWVGCAYLLARDLRDRTIGGLLLCFGVGSLVLNGLVAHSTFFRWVVD